MKQEDISENLQQAFPLMVVANTHNAIFTKDMTKKNENCSFCNEKNCNEKAQIVTNTFLNLFIVP